MTQQKQEQGVERQPEVGGIALPLDRVIAAFQGEIGDLKGKNIIMQIQLETQAANWENERIGYLHQLRELADRITAQEECPDHADGRGGQPQPKKNRNARSD
jgi:hypothetical protein